MKVCHIPLPQHWPPHGGVREHCRLLTKHLALLGVEFTGDAAGADLVHVQSAYLPPILGELDICTCHGGFWPQAIPQILDNLKRTRYIISVAEWIVEAFFPQYRHKTTIIPNGVSLPEWEDLGPSGLEPGFILWGKGFYRDDWIYFYRLAEMIPQLRFVSTLASPDLPPLDNLQIIGVQTQEQMRRLLHDAAVYVSTGSEVCPTMIPEAWAAKTPVLAWDAHGNRELMADNSHDWGARGGWLYQNLRGMCAGLAYCLRESEALGNMGYQLIKGIYNWELLALRTKAIYEELLYGKDD